MEDLCAMLAEHGFTFTTTQGKGAKELIFRQSDRPMLRYNLKSNRLHVAGNPRREKICPEALVAYLSDWTHGRP